MASRSVLLAAWRSKGSPTFGRTQHSAPIPWHLQLSSSQHPHPYVLMTVCRSVVTCSAVSQ